VPGPAPKPAAQRARRNAPLANTIKLPPGGRVGDPPAWPLPSAEPETWGALWATPQAVQWERMGWTRVVARYAHLVEITEVSKASALIFGEVRQMEDRLGLSPMAMLRLRWEVDELDEVADSRPAVSSGPKRRLKVV
jgi:hypothetical protein